MKKTYFLFVLFSFSISYSQLAAPFKLRYKASLKGDMTVISNNITNRVERNSSNVPYNTRNINSSKHNDEFIMGYIDIDTDKSTFSSSSADLVFENIESKKVVYAGLYWSATYKYNSGELTKQGKFLALDPERDAFNEIKIKLPSQEKYIDIKGEVLFDGINSRKFKENAPYAVYADITKELLSLSNPSGTYTVANIKSTVGSIKGGVAAGWTMFIVYEDASMQEKAITSFDGFAGVTNKAIDLVYSGFQTVAKGHVNAKIAVAALEGDSNLVGDQMLFKISNKDNYIPLSNLLRNENNFFNSTISIENEQILKRNPDSKNTLGYDSSLITIPNPDNSVIGNNIKEAKIRLKTSGDKYYLFFTAFNVECIYSQKTEETKEHLIGEASKSSQVIENISPKMELSKVSNTLQPESIVEPIKEPAYNVTLKPKLAVVLANTPTSVKEIFNYDVEGQPKGYYIIVNVFSKQINSIKFIELLKNKGINAAAFFNPIKKYYYVYIVMSNNKEEVESLHASKFNNSYTEDMWVLSVNKSKASSVIAESEIQKDKETNNVLTKEKVTTNGVDVAKAESTKENESLKTKLSGIVKVTDAALSETNKKEEDVTKSNTTTIVEKVKERSQSESKKAVEDKLNNNLSERTNTTNVAQTSEKNNKDIQRKSETIKQNPSSTTAEKEIFNYNITQQERGYYIIVNVFSKQKNSINFIRNLKNKGIKAASFFNPIKKYYYVYIVKSDKKEEIESLYASKLNNSYNGDMWVLSVNNSKQSSSVVYSSYNKVRTRSRIPTKKES